VPDFSNVGSSSNSNDVLKFYDIIKHITGRDPFQWVYVDRLMPKQKPNQQQFPLPHL
jgi:hypothetical protein